MNCPTLWILFYCIVLHLPLHCTSRAVNRVQAMSAAWRLHHRQNKAAQQQHQQTHIQEQLLQPAAAQLLLQCAPDSLLLAVEGGVLQRGNGDLWCFAWAAAQLAGGGACVRKQ